MKNTLLTTQATILHPAYYRIAGLWCRIDLPENAQASKLLSSSEAFRQSNPGNEKIACRIDVADDNFEDCTQSFILLSEVKGILGECLRLYENAFSYLTVVSFNSEQYKSAMVSNKDFSQSTVYLKLKDDLAGNALNSCFMVAFSQAAVLHKTVLIHASVVEKENLGFAFLGKSGTGKSTHSSLWLRHIPGTKLLNDDNPAVQVDADGSIFIHGTPWSGKTPCYIDKKVKLGALVRLQQASENRFGEAQGLQAMVALLPSCSSLRWNDYLYSSLCNILEKIIRKTPVCILECLPNQEASELCYKEIQKLRQEQTFIK